jgi:hypothetical protein
VVLEGHPLYLGVQWGPGPSLAFSARPRLGCGSRELSARTLVLRHRVPKPGLWKGFAGAPTAAKAAVGYLTLGGQADAKGGRHVDSVEPLRLAPFEEGKACQGEQGGVEEDAGHGARRP